MGNIFGRFLGASLQPRVYGKGHLRNFVNRSRHRRGLIKAISGAKGLQLVGINSVHHAVKQFAQLRVGVGVVAALQHPIDRVVEVLARGFQVPGFVVLLPGRKFLFYLLN